MPAENSPMISSCTVVATQAVPTPRVCRKLMPSSDDHLSRAARVVPARLSVTGES